MAEERWWEEGPRTPPLVSINHQPIVTYLPEWPVVSHSLSVGYIVCILIKSIVHVSGWPTVPVRWLKVTLRMKGFIWPLCPHSSPSLKKGQDKKDFLTILHLFCWEVEWDLQMRSKILNPRPVAQYPKKITCKSLSFLLILRTELIKRSKNYWYLFQM